MSRFRWADPWSDDDPAVRRGREALALRPTEEPAEPRRAAPERSAMTDEERRERVQHFLERVRAGDVAAAEQLRLLLIDK